MCSHAKIEMIEMIERDVSYHLGSVSQVFFVGTSLRGGFV